ncbi:MAG: biotin--[acetyl-CoA-carboxylase] ligase [Candidatus Solibacter usitatus]|nr:biotin--[acetyl-CoA-carboxylase] ligase [Candidatus Solibacter usitatus]
MPFDLDQVRLRLPGRDVVYFDTLDSTMHQAAGLAQSGCAAGTAVVAGAQTAGLGRHGHSWHSEPSSGLYVSIVLRPDLEPDGLPSLTLALGLAVAEAIARATGLECDLRWPNDILLGGKKAAGILVNVVESAAIAGIGINVNHQSFPGDLAGLATSLRLAAGRPFSREDLLVHLLLAVDGFCRMLREAGRDAILEVFERRSSYARGKPVVVYQEGGLLHGVTAGLDASGFLLVDTRDGKRETILAGGVRAAGA